MEKSASTSSGNSTNASSTCSTPTKIQSKNNHPIFNGKYEITKRLGDGSTAKVYLLKSLKDPSKQFALKVLKSEYIEKDGNALKTIQDEIEILQSIDHNNVVRVLGHGNNGVIKKQSGKVLEGINYIILEFVEGGILFDMCQACGAMGENSARFLIDQLVDVLEYMSNNKMTHRDLKLENVLVDQNLNLKVADFGFAKNKNIHKLKSYKGTHTYMAPEIKEGKTYNGSKVDVFSTGVILFILTAGIFPFQEARKGDYYYDFIIRGDKKGYFQAVGGEDLSYEFKDLFWKMVCYDPKQRIEATEIRSHPWMKKDSVHYINPNVRLYQKALKKRANKD